ncbi:hypothetical protein BaRGS_00003883, partial [Batillaria attramentaria]
PTLVSRFREKNVPQPQPKPGSSPGKSDPENPRRGEKARRPFRARSGTAFLSWRLQFWRHRSQNLDDDCVAVVGSQRDEN